MKDYVQSQTYILLRLVALAPTILVVYGAYLQVEKEINDKWN